MNFIFEKIKDLKPEQSFLKKRNETDFLIVSSPKSIIYYLGDITREIYLECNGNNTIFDIFTKISNEYDVSEEVLQDDIVELIRDFQWKNIVELNEVS